MGSSVGDSRGDVGDVPGALVVEHLNAMNAAVRAHSCNTDNIVGFSCGDPGDMGAMPETVLDSAHIAVLAHNLRGQVWVGIVYARIDDGDDNATATQSDS